MKSIHGKAVSESRQTSAKAFSKNERKKEERLEDMSSGDDAANMDGSASDTVVNGNTGRIQVSTNWGGGGGS